MKATKYVISVAIEGRATYFTCLQENGCPSLWTKKKSVAPLLNREAAIAMAQRLGDYLNNYSKAAAADARRISIRPSTGGQRIGWIYRPTA